MLVNINETRANNQSPSINDALRFGLRQITDRRNPTPLYAEISREKLPASTIA
jgi:hypothetical protein